MSQCINVKYVQVLAWNMSSILKMPAKTIDAFVNPKVSTKLAIFASQEKQIHSQLCKPKWNMKTLIQALIKKVLLMLKFQIPLFNFN